MARKLKYIGDGQSFVPGYPATDFTCELEAEAEELVAGGLYEYVTPAASGKKEEASASKEEDNGERS